MLLQLFEFRVFATKGTIGRWHTPLNGSREVAAVRQGLLPKEKAALRSSEACLGRDLDIGLVYTHGKTLHAIAPATAMPSNAFGFELHCSAPIAVQLSSTVEENLCTARPTGFAKNFSQEVRSGCRFMGVGES